MDLVKSRMVTAISGAVIVPSQFRSSFARGRGMNMAERSPVMSPLSLEAEATVTLENSSVEAAVQAVSKSIPSCGWRGAKKFTVSMAMGGES